jgi:hypothetical protein
MSHISCHTPPDVKDIDDNASVEPEGVEDK